MAFLCRGRRQPQLRPDLLAQAHLGLGDNAQHDSDWITVPRSSMLLYAWLCQGIVRGKWVIPYAHHVYGVTFNEQSSTDISERRCICSWLVVFNLVQRPLFLHDTLISIPNTYQKLTHTCERDLNSGRCSGVLQRTVVSPSRC